MGIIALESQALDNGWYEVGIGFLIHDDAEEGLFLDFNGVDEDHDCYIVMKGGCSEVWDVLFDYDSLAAKYLP